MTYSQAPDMDDVNITSTPQLFLPTGMSHEAYMGLGAYIIVTGVFGSVGNTLVVVMFVKNQRLSSAVDLLLLNLAIADLGLCGVCFPFVAASSFAEHWLFGETGCVVYGYLGFLFGNAAISTLSAISVQRYLVVCRHHSNARGPSTAMTVLAIWLLAISWSSFPLILPQAYALEPFGTSCTVAWASQDPSTRIFIYSLVGWVLLQFLLLISCYVSIYLTSRRDVLTTSTRSYQDLLVSKICFVLVSAFVLCWAPYAIFSMWLSVTSASIHPLITALPVMLAKVSACVNPILYIIVSERFRHKYFALITCRKQSAVAHAQQTTSRSQSGDVVTVPIETTEVPCSLI